MLFRSPDLTLYSKTVILKEPEVYFRQMHLYMLNKTQDVRLSFNKYNLKHFSNQP